MRLLETKTRMSVRARIVRVTAGLAVMAAGIVTATIFHVVPNMAEAQAATPSQVAAQSVPATPRDKHAMSIGLPASWPLGIANGRNAAAAKVVEGKEGYISVGPGSSGVTKVVMGKGDYIHLWKAADGEPFLIVNRAHQEPTLGEKHRIEKEFKEPRKQVDEANKVLNSPEFKQQMLKMQSELNTLQIPEIQQQAKDVTAQMMHVQKEIQSGQLQREMEVRRLSKDAQAAEAVRPAPVAQPVPQQPAPASSVPPRKIGQVSSKPKVGVHGFALQDGQHRNLTPAQRAQLQAEMAAVRQQIREETRQMQNPEFEQQMEVARKQFQDAIQKLQSEAMQRQQQVLQSPEFKEQIQKMEEMRQKLHGDRSGDTVQHP